MLISILLPIGASALFGLKLPNFNSLFTGGFGAFGGEAGGPFGCEILQGTNAHRVRRQRHRLMGNKRLDAAALIICQDMANLNVSLVLLQHTQKLDHNAGGTSPGQRIGLTGYDWKAVAENIYDERGFGDPDPQRALRGWINSPGHEKNMVGDYTHMGSAYCFGRKSLFGPRKIFWAQEFGRGFTDSPEDTYDCSATVEPVVPIVAADPVVAVEPIVQQPVVDHVIVAANSMYAPLPPIGHRPCVATRFGYKHYKRSLDGDKQLGKIKKSKARKK